FSAHVARTHPTDTTQVGSGMMYVGAQAIRTESNVRNQAVRVILRSDTNEIWVLFPDRKSYLKQQGPVSSRPPLPDEAASPCQTDKSYVCRRLGNARINNRDTQHWAITRTNAQGIQENTQLWIDPRLQVAIKELYHDGGMVELTDIREGVQNPDLFKVPSDFQPMALPGAAPSGSVSTP
ncbi:MAG: hypothetical protein HQL66_05445, partial [Magnetococcales bacterium]|nr:hypothetical protein [Magnetococcales bacterium]